MVPRQEPSWACANPMSPSRLGIPVSGSIYAIGRMDQCQAVATGMPVALESGNDEGPSIQCARDLAPKAQRAD